MVRTESAFMGLYYLNETPNVWRDSGSGRRGRLQLVGAKGGGPGRDHGRRGRGRGRGGKQPVFWRQRGSGAGAGGVSSLIFGGNVVQGAVSGAAIGAATGAATGAMAGSAADSAAKERSD